MTIGQIQRLLCHGSSPDPNFRTNVFIAVPHIIIMAENSTKTLKQLKVARILTEWPQKM